MRHILAALLPITCFSLAWGGPIVTLKGILGTGGQEPALGNIRSDIEFIGYRLPYETEPIYRVLHDRSAGPHFRGPAFLRKNTEPRFGFDILTEPEVVVIHDPQPDVLPSRFTPIVFPGSVSRGKKLVQEETVPGIEKDSFTNRIPQLEDEPKGNSHPNSEKLLKGIIEGIKKDIFRENHGKDREESGTQSSQTGTVEGIGALSPKEFRRVTRRILSNVG